MIKKILNTYLNLLFLCLADNVAILELDVLDLTLFCLLFLTRHH